MIIEKKEEKKDSYFYTRCRKRNLKKMSVGLSFCFFSSEKWNEKM